MSEQWKIIPEYPMYEASTLGNIRRIGRKKNRSFSKDKYGYMMIQMFHKGKMICKKVHRLILATFKPTDNQNLQVNHINEDKADNRLENLEWVTPRQNVAHSAKKIYHDSITHRMKSVLQYSLNGKYVREWESTREAAKSLGFNNGHIGKCCDGVYRQYNGFIWRWKNDTKCLPVNPVTNQPRELILTRSYLKRRGYVLDEGNHIAYWDGQTKRATRLERNPKFYKFLPIPDEPIEVELIVKKV